MMNLHDSKAIVFLLVLFVKSTASALTNYEKILESELIGDKLKLLQPEGLLRNRRSMNESIDSAVKDTCARDLTFYEQAIERQESWALKMLDSSSKIPAGLLQGYVIDMGMYDECVETESKSREIEIHGRHCMYKIKPRTEREIFFLNPTLSLCVPASCSANDILGLLESTINKTDKLKEAGFSVMSATCTSTSADRGTQSIWVLFTLCGTVVYISFLLFCTLIGLINRHGDSVSDFNRTLVQFSLIKSSESILSLKTREDSIPVIHGIRVISTFWVSLLHEYFTQFFGAHTNMLYITKWLSSRRSLYPLIGVYSVDTFLTLSGFLLSYNFFKQRQRNRKFNLISHYVHRFLRLTFPVIVVVIGSLVVIPHLGSGPRYEWLQDIFVTSCQTKWWSAFLYMINFVQKQNYCLMHLWSLSVDMQLYWVSPFILYPLYKRPKIGLAILTLLIFGSVTISASLVGMNKYSTIYYSHEYNLTHMIKAFEDVYEMPYTRASPWLIGILFGYEVVYGNITPNKLLIWVGWILTVVAFSYCIFGTRAFTCSHYEYDIVREVTFAALQRPIWAFAICWIVYASVHNSGGFVSKFLSSKIFVPFSKLSYCLYLIHIILPMLEIGISRAPKYFNEYSIIRMYISDMGVALVLAFFMSILFEIPVLVFDDIVLRRRNRLAVKEQKTK